MKSAKTANFRIYLHGLLLLFYKQESQLFIKHKTFSRKRLEPVGMMISSDASDPIFDGPIVISGQYICLIRKNVEYILIKQ